MSDPPRTVGASIDEPRVAIAALRQLVRDMAGRKLPGEREMSGRLGISRQRLRSLLARLEAEGAVVRRQGSGTYAADPSESVLSTVALLIDQRLKIGDDPFFSIFVERLQLGLQGAGVRCFIERIDGGSRPRYLGEGAITVGLAGRHLLRHLLPGDPPVVGLLDEPLDGPAPSPDRMSLLMVEDRFAGRAVARRAIAEGARRLVFLGRTDLGAARLRGEGLREVAFAAGVPVDSIDCGMNYASGLVAAPALSSRMCAGAGEVRIVAANDWLAVGIRSGLGTQCDVIPIYSFDGLRIASDPSLNILSMAYPMETIAEDALGELKRLARHRSGRVIRYSMEWLDGYSDQAYAGPAAIPPEPPK